MTKTFEIIIGKLYESERKTHYRVKRNAIIMAKK